MAYSVQIEWDDEASVWYVADSSVPGLITEAPTVELMLDRLKYIIPELLLENGITLDNEVPVDLVAQRHTIAYRAI